MQTGNKKKNNKYRMNDIYLKLFGWFNCIPVTVAL